MTGASADAIPAYCLPYVRGTVTKLQLGRDADFFFTSELNGCTLVIVNSPGNEAPLVVHYAGDLGRDIGAVAEVPLRDPMHSSPFTTLRPAATLSKALRSPKTMYEPTSQGDLDRLATAPGIEQELGRVRGRFGPVDYYDRLTRYDGLQNAVDFEVIGWRKPERGWRFYAQASGRFGAAVAEIRVMTKEMKLADGRTGNPVYVTTVWKGEPPASTHPHLSAWRRG